MNSTLCVTYVFYFLKKNQIKRTIKVGHKNLWLHLFWDGGSIYQIEQQKTMFIVVIFHIN